MRKKRKHKQQNVKIPSPSRAIIYKINSLYYSLIKKMPHHRCKTPIKEFQTSSPLVVKADNHFVCFLDKNILEYIVGIKIPLSPTADYVIFQRRDGSAVSIKAPYCCDNRVSEIVELILAY